MRHAIIYQGETYIRAKDLGAEPNSNLILHNPEIARQRMRPAEGFAPTEFDLYRKWLLEAHPRQEGTA